MADKEYIKLYGLELYKNATDNNLLYILAYIIDSCNYCCKYCYNEKPYTQKQLNLEYLCKFIKFVVSKHPDKYIQLELIGGEPTLHPDLVEFCNSLKPLANIHIKIFTNLQADITLYEELLSNKNLTLISSWHSLHNDKYNSAFIEKITRLLSTNKSQIEVRVMYEYDNTQAAIDVANKLLPYADPMMFDLSYVFDPKTGNADIYAYNDQQLKAFNDFHSSNNVRTNRKEFYVQYSDGSVDIKTFNDMFCSKNNKFKRWLCNAGKNSLFIDYNGITYPCVEYSSNASLAIFDICKPCSYVNYKFKPHICKVDFCTCDYDILKQKVFK